MNTSPVGIGLLKGFEKCDLAAYPDSGGVWTQGWGHTGPDVDRCRLWTQDEADAHLGIDLQAAEAAINHCVTAPLNQNQFDALASFVFNVGVAAFRGSTMLKYLNLRKFALADGEFLKWNHDNGKVVLGLARRRQAERALFISPVLPA